MKLKSFIGICLISLPLMSHAAEITITNNTDNYGTGKFGTSPCSNIAGDNGVGKPHQTLTVPQAVFDLFCIGKTCKAKVYFSKNCSGQQVATATIDPHKGVLDVTNLDDAHYKVNYTLTNVTVDPV
jgi:hypothetical protein